MTTPMTTPTTPTTTPTSARTSRRRPLVAALLALVATFALVAPTWALPEAETDASAETGADWTARQVAADGTVENGFSGPVGNAVQAGLALAATGTGGDAFERALTNVRENYETYVDDGTGDNPGALGYVALLADAADEDPTAFGTSGNETDLVQRIRDTRQMAGPDEGQYGTGTVFDRVFNHSLGLLGLATAEAAPDQSALDWLLAQQCPDGGWPSYRSAAQRAAGTCEDTSDEAGTPTSASPDSNSTALAAMALAAHDVEPTHSVAGWLAANQNDDGGWGFSPAFGETDANSTALVIQALAASGLDPTAGPWIGGDRDSPLTALRHLQLGCEAETAERGAFAFQPDEDGELQANGAATYAAVLGVHRTPYLDASFVPTARAATPSTRPAACADLTIDRHAGSDRIGTAAALATATHPQGADTVVLASAHDYADALAGGPLAASLNAPILLSHSAGLSPAAADAVSDLEASEAVLLGGTRALSEQVRRDLEDLGVDTERIGGITRFETAAAVAARVGENEVYVTEGFDPDPSRGWPDAVAVSSLASFQQRPILLVTTDELPEATATALEGRSATVVGGSAAVTSDVVEAITEVTGAAVDRIAGATRFDTSLAVSRVAREAGMDAATSWFATGGDYPDSLAAGPAVAARGGVLMLVAGSGLDDSPATRAYVHEVNLVLEALRIVGGEAAVPTGVVDGMTAAARGPS